MELLACRQIFTSFDQTLLLIDGVKLDDAQTGHHSMNLVLPLEVIERIEIVKGPAARVFGQNAFTGAINIVTKSALESSGVLTYQAGSYGQINAEFTIGSSNEKAGTHYTRKTAEGYRFNTDFTNEQIFLKDDLIKTKHPLNLLRLFLNVSLEQTAFMLCLLMPINMKKRKVVWLLFQLATIVGC